MLEKIRNNIVLIFTLSLVSSYFASYGHYLYFNIDITTYLTIEDLTLIFAKWIWLSIVVGFIYSIFLYRIFTKTENESSWWSQRIGKSYFKRRILVIAPILVLIIILFFRYKTIAEIISIIFLCSIFIFLIAAIYLGIATSLKDKKTFKDIKLTEGFLAVAGANFILIILPMSLGIFLAKNSIQEYVKIKFDDSTILQTKDSLNLRYIGKTSNYLFINNRISNQTTSYRIDKIKSIEVETSKNK